MRSCVVCQASFDPESEDDWVCSYSCFDTLKELRTVDPSQQAEDSTATSAGSDVERARAYLKSLEEGGRPSGDVIEVYLEATAIMVEAAKVLRGTPAFGDVLNVVLVMLSSLVPEEVEETVEA